MSNETFYEDTLLATARKIRERGYTIDDLQLMRAVMQWEGPRYVEFFGPFPYEEPAPKPPLREYLLAEGFGVEQVDTYLEDRALRAEDLERRAAEFRAEQAKWRYRFQVWRREHRARIRTAIEVLRGDHECDGEY